MDALSTLALFAVLLAAPCFVQLVLWTAYALLRALRDAVGQRLSADHSPEERGAAA